VRKFFAQNFAHPHSGCVLDSLRTTQKYCISIRTDFAKLIGNLPQPRGWRDENDKIGIGAISQLIGNLDNTGDLNFGKIVAVFPRRFQLFHERPISPPKSKVATILAP